MGVHKIFNKLHQDKPKFAQALSYAIACTAIIGNSILCGFPLWLSGAVKYISKNKFADKVVIGIADNWIRLNNKLIDNILPNGAQRDWQITLPDDLDPNKKYLLICNHQSWVDTSVIQYISQDKLALTRFFTKFELVYIPVIGQAFYFLDFPMMKRHSKEAIAKNPALKGQDIAEAKRACELLKGKPFTLLNYLEGTRFNATKHQQQQSPYQHLLKPRAGGFSLAISALGDEIDGILDMTIVYPDGSPAYNHLWKGKIKKLGVDIRHLDMPNDLFSRIQAGGYETDKHTKAEIFAWLDKVWQEKDQRISKMLAKFQ